MKAILCFLAIGTVILLGSVTFTAGQGAPPMDQPCSGYYGPVTLSDVTCSDVHMCDSPFSDCEEVEFTPTVSCQYTLTVSLICNGGSCSYCLACAWITSSACTMFHNNPNPDCKASETCYLTAGVPYKLHVCLRPAIDYTCSDCTLQGCTARAQVSM